MSARNGQTADLSRLSPNAVEAKSMGIGYGSRMGDAERRLYEQRKNERRQRELNQPPMGRTKAVAKKSSGNKGK